MARSRDESDPERVFSTQRVKLLVSESAGQNDNFFSEFIASCDRSNRGQAPQDRNQFFFVTDLPELVFRCAQGFCCESGLIGIKAKYPCRIHKRGERLRLKSLG